MEALAEDADTIMESSPRNEEHPWMRLTEEERREALELKAAHEERRLEEMVEEDQLKPEPALTDMEYALYAISNPEQQEKSLFQIHGLQEFRKRYKVQDSLEEGMAVLEEFLKLSPGVLLTVDVVDGISYVGWDYGKLFPAQAMANEAVFRVTILFIYYIRRIHQPTLHQIRAGSVYLHEGHTVGWGNICVEFETRCKEEFWMYDPIKFQQMRVFNTNSVANMANSLWKRLMPQQWKGVVELGCQIEQMSHDESRKLTLADIYLQPNYKQAMENVKIRARQLLELRLRHQKTFQLE